MLIGVCPLSSASVVVVDSEVPVCSVDSLGSSVSAGLWVPAVVTDSDSSVTVVASSSLVSSVSSQFLFPSSNGRTFILQH